jgi:hypothetical protein
MNDMSRYGSPQPAGLWRARAFATTVSAALLLLAEAERPLLARIAVELLVRLAQMTG